LEELTAPPSPLAVFKGPTSKGRAGRDGRGRKKEGNGDGKGREEKRRGKCEEGGGR